jgi:hypothetical protein
MANPQRIGTDHGERKVISDIAEYGWHSVNVLEDDGHPPWTFTIGLYETWNHPELIIIGRSRATAHHILNTVATGLEDNRRLDLASTTTTCYPAPPAASSKSRLATTPTTSASPAGTTAANPSPSTKSSGPRTTVTTPGARAPRNP